MEQEFQKLANFRDLGGLKGADGKAVRKKTAALLGRTVQSDRGRY